MEALGDCSGRRVSRQFEALHAADVFFVRDLFGRVDMEAAGNGRNSCGGRKRLSDVIEA